MPSPTRRSSSRKRSAATRIQTRARAKIQGQRTRKQHARSIEQMYRNLEKTNECAICHESMINNGSIIKLGCSHRFHTECVKKMVHRGLTTCPMCRTHMTITEIQSIRTPRQTRQTQRVMSDNPNPYLLHMDALSQLNSAQQELADYQSSRINDPQRERILNNRLRFANMELRLALGNFNNI